MQGLRYPSEQTNIVSVQDVKGEPNIRVVTCNRLDNLRCTTKSYFKLNLRKTPREIRKNLWNEALCRCFDDGKVHVSVLEVRQLVNIRADRVRTMFSI